MTRPASSTSDVLLYLLAIFISPLSVFLIRGCAADFWINICLYILGWIPGVIHAWWLISKHEKPAVVVAHHQQQHYGSTAQGAYTAVPAPAQPQYGAKPATGAQY